MNTRNEEDEGRVAAAMSAGTLDSAWPLMAAKATMIASGIRIEMIVRG